MATPRNRQYQPPGGGGGGGGLMSLIGAFMGAPGIEGGDVTSQIDPEIDLGTSAAPVIEPYKAKASFGQKLFNPRGVMNAQQQAQGLNQAMDFERFQQGGRQDLLNERLSAQEALKKGVFEEERAQAEAAHQRDVEKEELKKKIALDQLAAEKGFKSWDHYSQILENPDMMTAGVQGMYSDRAKQGLLNNEVQAKTAEVYGQTPTAQAKIQETLSNATLNKANANKANYLDVSPGHVARYIGQDKDPFSFLNAEEGQYENFPSGGPVTINDNGSFDVTKDGSLVRPIARKPVGEVTVGPITNTGAISPFIRRPTVGGEPIQSFNPQMGTTPVKQEPAPASLMNPQFKTNEFMQQFGPVINAIPILQDYLKKKGMFSPTQQY